MRETVKSRDASISKSPKYVQMLETYVELLKESDLLSAYKNMLMRTVMLDISDVKGDSLTLLWRKQLCILLLEHV